MNMEIFTGIYAVIKISTFISTFYSVIISYCLSVGHSITIRYLKQFVVVLSYFDELLHAYNPWPW